MKKIIVAIIAGFFAVGAFAADNAATTAPAAAQVATPAAKHVKKNKKRIHKMKNHKKAKAAATSVQ